MNDRTRILRGLRSGKSPAELAKALDMRKQTVSAMIELLIHRGLIKQIDCSSGCKGCMMGNSCPGSGGGREKLYLVDEEMIEEQSNSG
jgi:predicted transcriptional regulator